ncbi:MAG: 3'-5' exonuclease [Synergistaceae bacterium]|nr:3'-5' exonuclease [Synergistaceae bacterium]
MCGENEHKTVVAIDFETANYGLESACALSMVRVRDDNITDERTFLIKPPNRNFRFTYIHGIRWDDVRDSPTFADIFSVFSEFVKGADYLLAHNAPFDRGVLRHCCEYWDLKYPEIPFLCTLKGCRKRLSLQKNSLDFVCSHLNIPLKHHEAKSDAIAAAKIFIHLRKLGLDYSDLIVFDSYQR